MHECHSTSCLTCKVQSQYPWRRKAHHLPCSLTFQSTATNTDNTDASFRNWSFIEPLAIRVPDRWPKGLPIRSTEDSGRYGNSKIFRLGGQRNTLLVNTVFGRNGRRTVRDFAGTKL